MMVNNTKRLIDFLEASFLSPLLSIATITDISFNGEAIFYEDRLNGRKKAKFTISNDEAGAFLRQVANFAEKQFSYLSPILDVSFGPYRLNAVFLSIARVRGEKAYSFSLRIGHEGSVIGENPTFFPANTKRLILDALSKKEPIVIAGETGSGKTELQKYLLLRLPMATRVIVIDNVGELELARGDGFLDLTSWMVDERFPDSSFSSLIKNALRNNPDYLLVAETRGTEMLAALHASMSGHPIITTLHAKDLDSVPYRMARMAQGNDGKLNFDDLLGDIYHHFGLIVYLTKGMDGDEVRRRVYAIGRINEEKRAIDVLYMEKREGEE